MEIQKAINAYLSLDLTEEARKELTEINDANVATQGKGIFSDSGILCDIIKLEDDKVKLLEVCDKLDSNKLDELTSDTFLEYSRLRRDRMTTLERILKGGYCSVSDTKLGRRIQAGWEKLYKTFTETPNLL